MKRILAFVLLAALLCTALASCGGDENVLVCGVTPIAGLNEKDASGNYTIGFETEFAMAVAEILGMEVRFQEISWDQKYNELNSGAIDCVWNGFTANCAEKDGTERKNLVDFSYGYMLNQQCIVIRSDNADAIKSVADLAGKSAAVENGSAGDTYATSVTEGEIFRATVQADTFKEVKSGAVQFAVVDIVLARNICGKGNYEDLMIVEDIELESEIYAVGFKKGSPLTARVNEAIETLFENGKLMEIAEKYGFENVIQLSKTIE